MALNISEMTLIIDDKENKNCVTKFFSAIPLKLALVAFTVAFSASFQYGYSSTYINTAQLVFMGYLNQSIYDRHNSILGVNEFNWIWAIVVNSNQIGFVIGTLLIPYFAEKFGRRWSLLMSIIPETFGLCLATAAIPLQMPALLCIGRVIVSTSVGMNCTASTLFLQEISPTRIRGFISSFQEFSLCISSLAGLALGMPSVLGCQSCLVYLIAFGFIGTIPRLILIFCPDTPKYLLLKSRKVLMASKSVKFYHGSDAQVKLVLAELEKEGNLNEEETLITSDNKSVSTVKRLWNEKHVRKAVILGVIVFMAVESSGIVPIYEFSTYILENTGLNPKLAELGTLLMAVFNTIFTIVSMLIVERFGRRRLLLVGLVGLLTCLIAFMGFNIIHDQLDVAWAGYGAMICLILHSMIYSVGPGPICWFITSELVPQHLRSSAQAFTQFCNQVADLFISLVFFPAYTSIGPYAILVLCIIPLSACIGYIYFELPETKNREITDVVLEMKAKHEKLTGSVVKF